MANDIIGCTGITHVALHCKDFDKSYKFYTEGLGFKEFRRWDSDGKIVVLLDTGNGTYLEIFSNGKDRTCFDEEAGSYVHLALGVKDSQKAYERAMEYGARDHKYPAHIDIPSTPVLPCVISFVLGPDGEQIEFFEYK